MTKETKKWWEHTSEWYQKESKIPIDIHYGPGSPNEDKLKLLGNLKGKNVLEIGCGGAQCGIAMAKKGAKVTGIDISEQQLKFAKELARKNKVNIKFIQRDFRKFPEIKSDSQDIVFSAYALQYCDRLDICFKEVHRVLRKNGIFVFSFDHPFFRLFIEKKESYFRTGRWADTFSDPTKIFVKYDHTISELYNLLVKSGFSVEQILEPDSRKRHKGDPWYGLWDYTPELLKMVPPTIIFKARKNK